MALNRYVPGSVNRAVLTVFCPLFTGTQPSGSKTTLFGPRNTIQVIERVDGVPGSRGSGAFKNRGSAVSAPLRPPRSGRGGGRPSSWTNAVKVAGAGIANAVNGSIVRVGDWFRLATRFRTDAPVFMISVSRSICQTGFNDP